jgi:hypothetical protein
MRILSHKLNHVSPDLSELISSVCSDQCKSVSLDSIGFTFTYNHVNVSGNSSFSDYSSDDGTARSTEEHTRRLLKHEIQRLWLRRKLLSLNGSASDQTPTSECATLAINPPRPSARLGPCMHSHCITDNNHTTAILSWTNTLVIHPLFRSFSHCSVEYQH